jgi:hypothetical protein
LKHLLTLATIPLTTQEYLQTARIKKERPWQDLSLQVCLPEDLAALKNEYMCLMYWYILATFFCRLISNSKRRKLSREGEKRKIMADQAIL